MPRRPGRAGRRGSPAVRRGRTGRGGAAVGDTAPRLKVPRNPVLVAGVLPFLGEAAETEAGRLAPRDAGVERDLRTAAGLLAEAGATRSWSRAGRWWLGRAVRPMPRSRRG